MQIATIVFAVIAAAMAVTCVVVGAAGVTGHLPRNRWIGVRTAETLADDGSFALANRIAGPGIIGAGIIAAIGAVLGIGLGSITGLVFVLVALGAATVLAGVVSAAGVRAAAAAAAPEASCGAGGCGSCSLQGVCAADADTGSR